jgi:hypothetical protein
MRERFFHSFRPSDLPVNPLVLTCPTRVSMITASDLPIFL